MKSNVLLMGSLFICVNVFSQIDLEGNKFASTYMIVATFSMKTCDVDGQHERGSASASDVNTFIKLVAELENDVVIEFAKFPDNLEEIVKLYNVDYSGQIYFRISKNDFNSKCIRIYETWKPYLTYGSALIPVKIRKSPYDFSKDFTLGPSIGFKWRLDKVMPTYFNLLYSIGITSVTLNSDNATTVNNENIDIVALTQAVGLVAETSNIQFGIFWGWDRLGSSSQKKYQWAYNKNRWFSVGFGVTILSNQSKARLSYKINSQNLKSKQRNIFKQRNLNLIQLKTSGQ